MILNILIIAQIIASVAVPVVAVSAVARSAEMNRSSAEANEANARMNRPTAAERNRDRGGKVVEIQHRHRLPRYRIPNCGGAA